jgi:hypothetical protein
MTTSIPIACSLNHAQSTDRRAELAALGSVLTAVEAWGLHARLVFPMDLRNDVERFVETESSCCPFFSFLVTGEGGQVELRVEAPEGAEWAVRGLVAGFVAGWDGLL